MKLTLNQSEFDVLKEMVDERYQKLLSILSNKKSVLNDYEKDIKNYTTYDLHVKLSEVKWWDPMKWATDNSLDGMYK